MVRSFLLYQLEQRRRTPATIYAYRMTLRSYVDIVGAVPLDRVPVAKIEAWLDRPRVGRAHGHRGAAATVSKEVTMLRVFYRFMLARSLIDSDPTALLVAPSVHNVLPKPVSDETWTALWRADLDATERLFLGLGYFLGLRRREMVELSGVHVDRGREQLLGFTRKGGGDDTLPYGRCVQVIATRLPHLLPDADAFLRPLRDAADARAGTFLLSWADGWRSPPRAAKLAGLAPGQLDPQHLNRRLWWIADRVGVPRITPHMLRHSFVTNMLRAGVPLALTSRLANHSSVQTTLRYAKLGSDELGELIESWSPRNLPR
jgi:site-specific recombinase XerD